MHRTRSMSTAAPITMTRKMISRRQAFSTTPHLFRPPAQAVRMRDVEDEPMDYMASRGVGMEGMVEGFQRGDLSGSRSTGNYRDYIKAKIAQHDLLHPAPLTAASPLPSSSGVGQIMDPAGLTARSREKTGRHPLTDRYKRDHGYLRISLTERCNLRCTYCMPANGVPLSPPSHILTNSEIMHLSRLFVSQGVSKIRLTGGEPTLRKDLSGLVAGIGALRDQGLRIIGMTSNGVALGGRSDNGGKLNELVKGGLTHLNLSLDTLEEAKFEEITRRRGYSAVMAALDHALSHLTDAPLHTSLSNFRPGLRSVKLNSVLTRSTNLSELLSFAELTKERPISVRFIEFMPFSGNEWDKTEMVSYEEALGILKARYGDNLEMVRDDGDDGTSKRWRVKGYKGEIGFISSMSDHFCGTCNRLRITADGHLKVCLFDNTEVSLRDVMRSQDPNSRIDERLIDVISMAVGNKKPKHAGLGRIVEISDHRTVSPRMWRRSEQVVARAPWTMMKNGHGLGERRTGWLAIRQKHTSAHANGVKEPMLTHLDKMGRASMVSISNKASTTRRATAKGRIYLPQVAFNMLAQDPSGSTWKKGDVFGTARIAGIMAGKKTSDMIPLCHPISLTDLKVAFRMDQDVRKDDGSGWVSVKAVAECEGKTGVEMEALSAASVALLTVWDMVKAVAGKEMVMSDLMVTHKEGGKSGDWDRPGGWVAGEIKANEVDFAL